MVKIEIRRIEDNDIELMKEWLKKEHVSKWYHDPEDWLYEIKERNGEFNFLHHFIVLDGDKAIGFCQYYEYKYSGEDWNCYIPLEGTYSIDYLIGDETYLGKGYGKAIVRTLTNQCFACDNAKRIIVQPEEENDASCNTLLSEGYYVFDSKNKLYYKGK
ncbi:MAG: GNAT family N-acetyltransferase [Coprobacillaceae bacterium]